MRKTDGMSYEEFIEYAQEHYDKGGDSFVECWDKITFTEYVQLFGEITKRKALEMFRLEHSIQKDRQGWR